jgi:hypothetical protein
MAVRPYNPSTLSLTPGTRLGVYEVAAPIGEGGMGQVFRAMSPDKPRLLLNFGDELQRKMQVRT